MVSGSDQRNERHRGTVPSRFPLHNSLTTCSPSASISWSVIHDQLYSGPPLRLIECKVHLPAWLFIWFLGRVCFDQIVWFMMTAKSLKIQEVFWSLSMNSVSDAGIEFEALLFFSRILSNSYKNAQWICTWGAIPGNPLRMEFPPTNEKGSMVNGQWSHKIDGYGGHRTLIQLQLPNLLENLHQSPLWITPSSTSFVSASLQQGTNTKHNNECISASSQKRTDPSAKPSCWVRVSVFIIAISWFFWGTLLFNWISITKCSKKDPIAGSTWMWFSKTSTGAAGSVQEKYFSESFRI